MENENPMNEEISKKIVQWIEGLKDLAAAEIPPFVQEVARYGFIENLVEGIIIAFVQLLLISAAVFCLYKLNTIQCEKYSSTPMSYGMAAFMCGVVTLILLGPLTHCINSMIKAKCAPKLYVIERFMSE